MGATIVVGIDGSEQSLDALRWAVEEARLRDGRVVAVHAWQLPSVPGLIPTPPVDRDKVEEGARGVLDGMIGRVADAAGDVRIQPELIEAHPVEALLTQSRQADLLVVGSRGLGGVKRVLLGSVSNQLAHHSPCPLVIIPPRGD